MFDPALQVALDALRAGAGNAAGLGDQVAPMTEAEARVLLRDCGGFGSLEAWITGRRWKAAPRGWFVTGELQGWQFRLDVIPAGLRISASVPGGGDPAVWVVTR